MVIWYNFKPRGASLIFNTLITNENVFKAPFLFFHVDIGPSMVELTPKLANVGMLMNIIHST